MPFLQEKKNVLDTLALKAKVVADGFNSMDGVTCNTVMGAMYSFPNITLPQKAIEKAKVSVPLPPSLQFVFLSFRMFTDIGHLWYFVRQGIFHSAFSMFSKV